MTDTAGKAHEYDRKSNKTMTDKMKENCPPYGIEYIYMINTVSKFHPSSTKASNANQHTD